MLRAVLVVVVALSAVSAAAPSLDERIASLDKSVQEVRRRHGAHSEQRSCRGHASGIV